MSDQNSVKANDNAMATTIPVVSMMNAGAMAVFQVKPTGPESVLPDVGRSVSGWSPLAVPCDTDTAQSGTDCPWIGCRCGPDDRVAKHRETDAQKRKAHAHGRGKDGEGPARCRPCGGDEQGRHGQCRNCSHMP